MRISSSAASGRTTSARAPRRRRACGSTPSRPSAARASRRSPGRGPCPAGRCGRAGTARRHAAPPRAARPGPRRARRAGRCASQVTVTVVPARRVDERVLDQVVERDRDVLLARADERVAVALEREPVAARLGARQPALVAPPRTRCRSETGARSVGPVAVAREREQRVQQPRQPLDLGLGELELVPTAGSSRLQAGRLEPEPEAGERRPQLVRRVADELALRLEHLAEPVGHVVERDRDLLLLARAGHLGARVELAVLDAPRRSRQRAQRPRERAGEHPGEREAERERRQADADDDEHVAAHPLGDGGVALRDADGADRAALVEDRHGGVEELVADACRCAAFPGASVPASAAAISGRSAYGLAAEPGAGRVGEQAAARADDDHARAEVAARLLDDAAAAARGRRAARTRPPRRPAPARRPASAPRCRRGSRG